MAPPPSDVNADSELIEYYRFMASEIERDRVAYLAKLERIEIGTEEAHRNRWRAVEQDARIDALEAELSDARARHAEAREELAQVRGELDELRLDATHQQTRMNQLLSMHGPNEPLHMIHHIT